MTQHMRTHHRKPRFFVQYISINIHISTYENAVPHSPFPIPRPPPPSCSPLPLCLLRLGTHPQVLKNNGVEFLRMANDRGWTFANDVEGGDGKPLFVRVSGGLVEET